jgi:uncharacterized protein with HEPN domain
VSHRRWQDRIRDILDAAAEILTFTAGMDGGTFAADAKTVKAVVSDFAIIGEAARHMPHEVVEGHADIPWQAMRDMRNLVVHAYFNVEPAILWETIQNDLPPLIAALDAVLREAKDS